MFVATMGNATVNSEWPTCVGCAILHRSFAKTKTEIPDACAKCYKKFCWDGTVDDSKATYRPKLKLDALKSEDQESGGSRVAISGLSMSSILIVLTLALAM